MAALGFLIDGFEMPNQTIYTLWNSFQNVEKSGAHQLVTVEIYNGASFYRFEMMDFDVSDGGGGGGGTANGSKIYLVERFVIETELEWNLTMEGSYFLKPLTFGRKIWLQLMPLHLF